MTREDESDDEYAQRKVKEIALGFFPSLLKGVLESLIVIAIVFCVVTAISAAVCLYYNLPLVLSLIGGFISIGVVFLFKSDSIFD
ncbi:MAG: hypothetical protein V7696_14860 [Halioglobus sp.]